MGRRQLAELRGEALLALAVERRTPEDERLVLVEGLADEGQGLRVERRGDVDADDLGADPAGDLADVTDGCGAHAACSFVVDVLVVDVRVLEVPPMWPASGRASP